MTDATRRAAEAEDLAVELSNLLADVSPTGNLLDQMTTMNRIASKFLQRHLDAARTAGHDAGYREGVEAAAKVAEAYQEHAIECATDVPDLIRRPWEERSIGAAHVAQGISDLLRNAPVADAGAGETNKEIK